MPVGHFAAKLNYLTRNWAEPLVINAVAVAACRMYHTTARSYFNESSLHLLKAATTSTPTPTLTLILKSIATSFLALPLSQPHLVGS